MDLRPSAIAQRFIAGVDRAFGGEQQRVVAVQLGRQPSRGETTATNEIPRYDQGESWWDWQATEASRIERYRDMREGISELFEWDKALAVRVGYCFNATVAEEGNPISFRLAFGRGARPEVQAICEGVTDRLDLHSRVQEIYAGGQWLGDSPDELVFEVKSRALVDLKHWEPERFSAHLHRVTGRVSHYTLAVGEDWNPAQPVGNRVEVPPFLMLHYGPNKRPGQVYGWSAFGSGRKERREYEAANDALVMGQGRALQTESLLWPFPREGNKDEIWRWIKRVMSAAEMNLQFNKDGVLRRRFAKLIQTTPRVFPFLVDPDLKDPPTHFSSPVPPLDEMLKVAQWKQDNVVNSAGVPALLLGMTRNLSNRATATEEAAQFAVQIMRDQSEVARNILTPIYVRACMAAGYEPRKGEVKIEMFPPSQLYERMRADVAKAQAEACKLMVEAGTGLSFAMQRSFNLSEVEVTDVLGDVQTADVGSVDAMEETVGRAVEAAFGRHGFRPASAEVTAAGQPEVVLERAG